MGRFYPLYEDQKSVSFKLYRSTDPYPHYTDEPSVERVGVISVAIPDTTGGKDRPIDVAMKFGGTEIEVEAVAVLSKERAHITIDFQSNDEESKPPVPSKIGMEAATAAAAPEADLEPAVAAKVGDGEDKIGPEE